MTVESKAKPHPPLPFGDEVILADYRLAYMSRQASLAGRREVMSGKAKFGIFGDGKELPQVALAHAFHKGDFRSGYYRDQTLMFATGEVTLQHYFAQLYAHADVEADPMTAGRAMNAHFATRSLDENGQWKNLMEIKNSAADVSPTGSQMPRLVGLAFASCLFQDIEELKKLTQFSKGGSEVAFGTIGNATTAEGLFWESINAIGVLEGPLVLSIWDDEYGISVHNEHQVFKHDVGEMLMGFQRVPGEGRGFEIRKARGWNYPEMVQIYLEMTQIAREHHVPVIVHVVELTQPQGHSTSGSHERYKSTERLEWEEECDALVQFHKWIVEEAIASEEDLSRLEGEIRQEVEQARREAWKAYITPIQEERKELTGILAAAQQMAQSSKHKEALAQIGEALNNIANPLRRDNMVAVRKALFSVRDELPAVRARLIEWKREQHRINEERYGSYLYSQSEESALKVPVVAAVYSDSSPAVYGFEVLNACFDAALSRDPRVVAFGEDLGRLGDVNQGFRGLQEKYGVQRVADTGIREATIIGQGIGLAMRGLRPIAEIQYLDYLLYALQILSDDLATLHWRTHGGQKAPLIVRTRGHRLEGIWHSGSPMAGIIHMVRGIHVLVPRNMTQAAGFYNTLLQSDDPGLVIEVLNGYRFKERLPDNIGEFTVPLGVPEVLRDGSDITIVTYGACVRIVLEAAALLAELGVEAEVIDVQSLLPFDIHAQIVESLKKTGRILFVDEDVPGGGTAYIMQEVIEKQGGYSWLDSPPRTLPARAHRPAYGSDGDYWSKPNVEDVIEAAYDLMHEADPQQYPLFY